MKRFVAANVGINHNGDMEKAKVLIKKAQEAGCDGICFDIYSTERRIRKESPDDFYLYKNSELTYTDFSRLKAFADKRKIEMVIAPYDQEALSYAIDQMGVRRIVTPSLHILNPAFLDVIASYGKLLHNLHVYVPTGNAPGGKIKDAVERLSGIADVVIMHSMPGSPTPDARLNLSAIDNIRMLTGSRVGYFDYSDGILAPSLSVLVGARAVFKNLDIENTSTAVDPYLLKDMVVIIKDHEAFLGHGRLGDNE